MSFESALPEKIFVNEWLSKFIQNYFLNYLIWFLNAEQLMKNFNIFLNILLSKKKE